LTRERIEGAELHHFASRIVWLLVAMTGQEESSRVAISSATVALRISRLSGPDP